MKKFAKQVSLVAWSYDLVMDLKNKEQVDFVKRSILNTDDTQEVERFMEKAVARGYAQKVKGEEGMIAFYPCILDEGHKF